MDNIIDGNNAIKIMDQNLTVSQDVTELQDNQTQLRDLEQLNDQIPREEQEQLNEQMQQLEKMEKQIRKGLATYQTVGALLLKIRDEKLYKVRGYHSFEEYCKKEFNLSKSYGYHLMAHSEICGQIGVSPADIPEKVIRPLSRIKDIEERMEVWEEALQQKKGAYPTSKAVTQAVKAHLMGKESEAKSAEEPDTVDYAACEADPGNSTVVAKSGNKLDDLVNLVAATAEEDEAMVERVFPSAKPTCEDSSLRYTKFAPLLDRWDEAIREKNQLDDAQKEQIKAELLTRFNEMYAELMY